MSKTPSTHLYSLIQSLNSEEKSYFKKYGKRFKRSDDNLTLQLFDAILAQKKPDEKTLIGSQNITTNYIKLKQRLYNMVLDSLKEYHHKKLSSQYKVAEHLAHAQLLKERGLYKEAIKSINKAKKIAINTNNAIDHLRIYKALSEIYILTSNTKELKTHNEQINNYLLHCNAIYNEMRFVYLYNTLKSFLTDKLFPSHPKQKEFLEKIVSDPLLKDEKNAISSYSKILFHNIWFYYHFIFYNTEKTLNSSLAIIDLFHDQIELINELPDLYITSIKNALIASYSNREIYEDLRSKLLSFQTPRNVKEKTLHLKGFIFGHILAFDMAYPNDRGHYEKGKQIYLERENMHNDLLRSDQYPLPFKLAFNYQLAKTFFGTKDYDRTIEHLSMILAYNHKVRKDVIYFARILEVVTLFEQQEIYRAELQLEKIKDDTYFSKLTDIFTKHFKKLFNINSDHTKIYRSFVSSIEQYQKEKGGIQLDTYFEFKAWALSKLNKTSFAEQVQILYKEEMKKRA